MASDSPVMNGKRQFSSSRDWTLIALGVGIGMGTMALYERMKKKELNVVRQVHPALQLKEERVKAKAGKGGIMWLYVPGTSPAVKLYWVKERYDLCRASNADDGMRIVRDKTSSTLYRFGCTLLKSVRKEDATEQPRFISVHDIHIYLEWAKDYQENEEDRKDDKGGVVYPYGLRYHHAMALENGVPVCVDDINGVSVSSTLEGVRGMKESVKKTAVYVGSTVMKKENVTIVLTRCRAGTKIPDDFVIINDGHHGSGGHCSIVNMKTTTKKEMQHLSDYELFRQTSWEPICAVFVYECEGKAYIGVHSYPCFDQSEETSLLRGIKSAYKARKIKQEAVEVEVVTRNAGDLMRESRQTISTVLAQFDKNEKVNKENGKNGKNSKKENNKNQNQNQNQNERGNNDQISVKNSKNEKKKDETFDEILVNDNKETDDNDDNIVTNAHAHGESPSASASTFAQQSATVNSDLADSSASVSPLTNDDEMNTFIEIFSQLLQISIEKFKPVREMSTSLLESGRGIIEPQWKLMDTSEIMVNEECQISSQQLKQLFKYGELFDNSIQWDILDAITTLRNGKSSQNAKDLVRWMFDDDSILFGNRGSLFNVLTKTVGDFVLSTQ